jgi:DNA-binding XRE family transcriptional regulator
MNIFQKLAKEYGTQKKAAEALAVPCQTYSDWATGKKTPSVVKAKKISKELGISLDDIYN